MKRLLLLMLIAISLSGFGQYQEIENGESGLSVRTKLNSMHSELYDLNLTAQFAVAVGFWHDDYVSTDNYIRYSTDLGTTWSDPLFISNGIDRVDSLNMDENRIVGLPTPLYDSEAAPKSYVDSRAAGIDSIVYGDDYYIRVYLDDAVLDSTYIQAEQNVYSIVLPSSSSVSGRIATPTSLPDGWALTDDGINLIITHNLDRWSADVTIKANTSGTIWDQQRNTAAYSYYSDLSSNQIKIWSLCTAFKPIRINITFE